MIPNNSNNHTIRHTNHHRAGYGGGGCGGDDLLAINNTGTPKHNSNYGNTKHKHPKQHWHNVVCNQLPPPTATTMRQLPIITPSGPKPINRPALVQNINLNNISQMNDTNDVSHHMIASQYQLPAATSRLPATLAQQNNNSTMTNVVGGVGQPSPIELLQAAAIQYFCNNNKLPKDFEHNSESIPTTINNPALDENSILLGSNDNQHMNSNIPSSQNSFQSHVHRQHQQMTRPLHHQAIVTSRQQPSNNNYNALSYTDINSANDHLQKSPKFQRKLPIITDHGVLKLREKDTSVNESLSSMINSQPHQISNNNYHRQMNLQDQPITMDQSNHLQQQPSSFEDDSDQQYYSSINSNNNVSGNQKFMIYDLEEEVEEDDEAGSDKILDEDEDFKDELSHDDFVDGEDLQEVINEVDEEEEEEEEDEDAILEDAIGDDAILEEEEDEADININEQQNIIDNNHNQVTGDNQIGQEYMNNLGNLEKFATGIDNELAIRNSIKMNSGLMSIEPDLPMMENDIIEEVDEDEQEDEEEDDDRIFMSCDNKINLEQDEYNEQYLDINNQDDMDRRATNHVHAIDGHSKSMLNDIHKQRTIVDNFDEGDFREDSNLDVAIEDNLNAKARKNDFDELTSTTEKPIQDGQFVEGEKDDKTLIMRTAYDQGDEFLMQKQDDIVDNSNVDLINNLTTQEGLCPDLEQYDEFQQRLDNEDFDNKQQGERNNFQDHLQNDQMRFDAELQQYNNFEPEKQFDIQQFELQKQYEARQQYELNVRDEMKSSDDNELHQQELYDNQEQQIYQHNQKQLDRLEEDEEDQQQLQMHEQQHEQNQEPLERAQSPKNDYDKFQQSDLPKARIRWITAVNKIVNRSSEVSNFFYKLVFFCFYIYPKNISKECIEISYMRQVEMQWTIFYYSYRY